MHQQGALAYQKTAKVVESARERESALLMKAAAGIQRVKDEWATGTHDDLKVALTFNRKLWTIFMSSVTKTTAPCPRKSARISPTSVCSFSTRPAKSSSTSIRSPSSSTCSCA